MMDTWRYDVIGPDRPLGDREDVDEDTTSPEEIARISEEEVKNPADGAEILQPDEPSKD